MGLPTPAKPVKLFVALLTNDPALFTTSVIALQSHYGPVDLASETFPWNMTEYYRKEMGENLLRKFVTFERLIVPDALAGIKLTTNELEMSLSGGERPTSPRRVNLDPGYVDRTKLVLASAKDQAHRIYLSQGIYAEVTLLYYHGEFHPFIYTYPDYQWPETYAFLRRAQQCYRHQLRLLKQEKS
ncbi:MAG: DUF4416 family protein [Deltaproteobacteria bacterium]|nr:DUF4416 family protein [Deltaproteobacteria bacterium]